MLATSSCWYAGFGGELLLAVHNYSTYMGYLGEHEFAPKTAILMKLVANIQYYISKNGKVDSSESIDHLTSEA